MIRNTKFCALICLIGFFSGCETSYEVGYNPLDDYEQLDPATIFAMPEPLPNSDYSIDQVSRGKYLIGLLGCGSCHTDGALVGVPDPYPDIGRFQNWYRLLQSVRGRKSGNRLSTKSDTGHGNRARHLDDAQISTNDTPGHHRSQWA